MKIEFDGWTYDTEHYLIYKIMVAYGSPDMTQYKNDGSDKSYFILQLIEAARLDGEKRSQQKIKEALGIK